MMDIHECVECKKLFMSNQSSAKYCSNHCRFAAADRRKAIRAKKKIPVKRETICVICGKPIDLKKRGSRAKTCSKECGEILRVQTDKRGHESANAKRAGVSLEEYRQMHMRQAQQEFCGNDDIYKSEIRDKRKRQKERSEAAEKYKKQGIKEDLEAKELGISHGEYQALKSMGKLDEFKKRKQPKVQNKYASTIIGD